MAHKLFSSPVFCMAPWVHLYVNPDGATLPCCIADHTRPLGNLREQTLMELWNSERMRGIRRNMLAGERSPECQQCYDSDAAGLASARHEFNRAFAHRVGLVSETRPDGSLARLSLGQWDFRFSNVCNFRCRGCNWSLSSGWYEDGAVLPHPWTRPVDAPRVQSAVGDFAKLWEQLEPNLDDLELIYFAGGEPLFMEEHAFLLRELIARGKTRVALRYSTNLSRLSYGGVDFVELWRQFESVLLAVSVDGVGARGEYIRKGMSWDLLLEYCHRVAERAPKVWLLAQATVSLLNAMHIPDLQHALTREKAVHEPRFSFNILREPGYLNMQALPRELKDEVRRRYRHHLDNCIANAKHDKVQQHRKMYEGAIAFMDAADATDRLPEFRTVTAKLDEARGENCAATFPELASLWA